MKTFSDYINEKQNFIFGGKAGLTGKEYKQHYNYSPKDRDELEELMKKLIKERGDEADFNDINTSDITDMNCVIAYLYSFNGNISLWDVSSVTNMEMMFERCKRFNGDISMWDVSSVTDMCGMFERCKRFNGDISMWDVSNVTTMQAMFNWAESFDQDISCWDVSHVTNTAGVFKDCPIKEEFKPKFKK